MKTLDSGSNSLYKSWKKFISIVLVTILINTVPYAQNACGPAVKESNGISLSSKLISSSRVKSYKFFNPFIFSNVNFKGDLFGYSFTNNTLSFTINRVGSTQSYKQELFIIFENVETAHVRVQDGSNNSSLLVKDFVIMTAPSNNVYDALFDGSSVWGSNPKIFKAYKLGSKSWSDDLIITVKLKNGISNDFYITTIAKNPNRTENLEAELGNIVFAPINIMLRLLGESNRYSNISFVSHKILKPEDNKEEDWPRDEDTKVVDVTNSETGQTWMDRNLGASRAATNSTDTHSYGDLYQWGRAADGHEKRNSATTSGWSSSDIPDHDDFITAGYDSDYDWRSPQNDNLWQGANGTNNPCPRGYRLPTAAEWEAERQSWSSNNAAGAFASPLKLPAAGYRFLGNGSLSSVGSSGLYWSSTTDGVGSRRLFFSYRLGNILGTERACAHSVRCIKDLP